MNSQSLEDVLAEGFLGDGGEQQTQTEWGSKSKIYGRTYLPIRLFIRGKRPTEQLRRNPQSVSFPVSSEQHVLALTSSSVLMYHVVRGRIIWSHYHFWVQECFRWSIFSISGFSICKTCSVLLAPAKKDTTNPFQRKLRWLRGNWQTFWSSSQILNHKLILEEAVSQLRGFWQTLWREGKCSNISRKIENVK